MDMWPFNLGECERKIEELEEQGDKLNVVSEYWFITMLNCALVL